MHNYKNNEYQQAEPCNNNQDLVLFNKKIAKCPVRDTANRRPRANPNRPINLNRLLIHISVIYPHTLQCKLIIPWKQRFFCRSQLLTYNQMLRTVGLTFSAAYAFSDISLKCNQLKKFLATGAFALGIHGVVALKSSRYVDISRSRHTVPTCRTVYLKSRIYGFAHGIYQNLLRFAKLTCLHF